MPTFTIDPLTSEGRAEPEPPIVDLRVIEWPTRTPAGPGWQHHMQFRRPAEDWQDVPVQIVAKREAPPRLPIEQEADPHSPPPPTAPVPDGTILHMPVQMFHEPTTGSLILFATDKHHAHAIFRAQGWASPEDVATMRGEIRDREATITALRERNQELVAAGEEAERINLTILDRARRLSGPAESIGAAIQAMKAGRSMARRVWHPSHSARLVGMLGISGPTIVVLGPDGSMQPWQPTTDDLLATDWFEVAQTEP